MHSDLTALYKKPRRKECSSLPGSALELGCLSTVDRPVWAVGHAGPAALAGVRHAG